MTNQTETDAERAKRALQEAVAQHRRALPSEVDVIEVWDEPTPYEGGKAVWL